LNSLRERKKKMERKNNYRILGIQIILEQKERLSLQGRKKPINFFCVFNKKKKTASDNIKKLREVFYFLLAKSSRFLIEIPHYESKRKTENDQ